MKLEIGTAQFGLNYGISNINGKTSEGEAEDIIKYAIKCGISCLDTAREYSESEKIIGNIIERNELQDNLKIITKVSKKSAILDDLHKSLSELKTKKIYGLLIHNVKTILCPDGQKIYRELLKAKDNGLVEKIGITLYTPEEARSVIEKFDLDIIQFPCSILDQRFISSGILEKIKSKNIEVHIRSIFLQGLYFLSSHNIPSYFKPIERKIIAIDKVAQELGISKLKLLIDYAKSLSGIDNIIVGINNLQHIKDIIEAYNDSRNTYIDYSKFAVNDDNYTNISKWRI